MNLVILGPPGAGKGTQAVRIAEHLNIPHISTGDILRDNVKRGTDLGIKAKEFMDSGRLVPDDLIIALIEDRLKNDDCANGFILDGFPRTIPQAEGLAGIIEIDVVLNIDVPFDDLLARLTGRRSCPACGFVFHVVNNPPSQEDECDNCSGELVQRPDDTELTVANRLEVYTSNTAPLIVFYNEKGILLDIDGTGSIQDIFDRMISALPDPSIYDA